jgi:hypothetical protein
MSNSVLNFASSLFCFFLLPVIYSLYSPM